MQMMQKSKTRKRRKHVSGVLCPIFSLPGSDFDPSAYEFVLWLEAAKQRRWQILPLQASEDPCVYAGCSGSALNIYYISTEKLVEDAFLDSEDLENNPAPVMERFDFGVIRGYRLKMLNLAWDKWKLNPRLKEAFNGFKASEQYWLDEWADIRPSRNTMRGRLGLSGLLDWRLPIRTPLLPRFPQRSTRRWPTGSRHTSSSSG